MWSASPPTLIFIPPWIDKTTKHLIISLFRGTCTEKMTEIDHKVVVSQLEEKVLCELKDNHHYEALQYVQSFVARKKKLLGQNTTSLLVFHGAKLMIQHQAHSSAGTLLCWFIEEGAGTENAFKLQKNKLDSENYCDTQRLIDLLENLPADEASLIVDLVYGPFHALVAKARISESNAGLSNRINKLEIIFANVFDGSKRWLNAYKSFVRLGDAKKASATVNKWSGEGYKTEKPLFFSRALLQLLADGKISLAGSFLHHSASFVEDNLTTVGGGPDSSALAVWHLATILTELANMEPKPRVDKKKLFSLLYQRYTPLLLQLDPKLAELVVRTGELVFGCQLTQQREAPNPMAMLQGLLGGGGGDGQQRLGNGGGGGAPDLSSLMSMMSKMNGGK